MLATAHWLKTLKEKSLWLEGELSVDFKNISSDTRELSSLPDSSTLFFARKGTSRDAHDLLSEIAENKSIAGFCVEKRPANFVTTKPVIVVRNATEAMGIAAKMFWGDPSAASFCAAVTGTNGKTTTTFLIQALLQELKMRPLRMGTIETEFEGEAIPSELTTPDFSQIQKLFSEFKKKGADSFVFEASSHALEQKRLIGLELDVALFTNLTQEHLDYHRSMENYYLAKKRLFSELLKTSSKKRRMAIIPRDGSFGSRLIEDLQAYPEIEKVVWAHADKDSSELSYVIKSWNTNLEGTDIDLEDRRQKKSYRFHSELVGEYNVENLVGMIALGLSLEMSVELIQNAISRVKLIPGRLERVAPQSGLHLFVDYAHTPDALENVLATLRPLTSGKLKVVFGCGGDRDKGKRPKMAAIAELYADEIFVTSDNPRTEDPEEIINEVLQGLQRLKPIHVDADRRKMIQKSLVNLGPKDVLVVAGKGHENYQILGQTKIHFDDREELKTHACQKLFI